MPTTLNTEVKMEYGTPDVIVECDDRLEGDELIFLFEELCAGTRNPFQFRSWVTERNDDGFELIRFNAQMPEACILDFVRAACDSMRAITLVKA